MNGNTLWNGSILCPFDMPRNTSIYFFTDELIAHSERVSRRWMHADILTEPVLFPDRPWEGNILTLFGTILKRPGHGYWMYYSNYDLKKQDLLLAKSLDGLTWEKPDLGICNWRGSAHNNIVLPNKNPGLITDSPSLMYDVEDGLYPYKLIMAEKNINNEASGWQLAGYCSQDGLLWEKLAQPLMEAGDRTNVVSERVNGKIVMYTREKNMMGTYGLRVISRSESEDFVNWSQPELVMKPDLEDDPDVEFYGMSVFIRNGWHIGLLEYWKSALDEIQVHLAVSRDGKKWIRPRAGVPFIIAEHAWNRKWNSCASNGPLLIGDRMAFYFGARSVAHSYDSLRQDGVIGVASIPIDRFCALEALAEGLFVTVPLRWPGGELSVNADTRESYDSHPGYANGSCEVELMDVDGRPLDDWNAGNKAIFRGNTYQRAKILDGIIRWPNNKKMDILKNQIIRIRFRLRHARLFTIEATE